jgi:curved DNA-binding protein CbpA
LPELAPTEIKALARIIDELDYYQLMHVERGATARDVKRAYHASSRTFHPDSNRHLSGDLQDAVASISKRIAEAYVVLRDPRRRAAYDSVLEDGSTVRIQLAEAEASVRKKAAEDEGRTPQGRQYYQLAKTAAAQSDWDGVLRNLQTALTFEPGNTTFKALHTEARQKLGYRA